MTCLQTILHALALHGRPVMLRVSTLAERAGPELAALRPDLLPRDQIKHWASLQGLVAHWDREELMVTFHPTAPLALPMPDRETGRQGEEETQV